MTCMVCGGGSFVDSPVLWDELVEVWELTAAERTYVDRQQGTHCTACHSNLRSGALAAALLDVLGGATLVECVASPATTGIALLEMNEAGTLHSTLAKLPGHCLARYPEVDLLAMPYGEASFDLVVHSDTLEHVPKPEQALAECLRVLRPGGALCYTVPIVVGRLTRSCEGRPPSYHGFPGVLAEDFRVQTEFGADAWTFPLRAGFTSVTIATIEYPAALALTAWKGQPSVGLAGAAAEVATLRAELAAIRASRSWRLTSGLRQVGTVLRHLAGRG
jgi:SAM-dependent methyltransferase